MSEQDVCGRCGQPLKSHESISVATVGLRCYRCFNEETAAKMGVAFDNTPLQPITVSDADGAEHRFEFHSLLVATGHALHARETGPEGQEGYEFSVLGDFDANVGPVPGAPWPHSTGTGRPPRGARRARLADYGRRSSRRPYHVGSRPRGRDSAAGNRRPDLHLGSGRPDVMAFEGFTLRAFVSDRIEVIEGPLLAQEEKA